MSVDGFSMSSLGMPKDITSAQAAITTEQGINTGNEKIVGKIDRALNKKINNEDKEENKRNKYFSDGYKDSEDDEDDEDSEQSKLDKDEKMSYKKAQKLKPNIIKDPENVEIKFNSKTDKVELYNKVTKRF